MYLTENVAIARFEGEGLLNKRTESLIWNKFIIANIKWTKNSAVTELIIA